MRQEVNFSVNFWDLSSELATHSERLRAEQLKARVDALPRHVAIIMDGNRRFAEREGLSVRQGHALGAERMHEIVRFCQHLGVRYVTVYAFSTENHKRSVSEVTALMELFVRYFTKYDAELKEEGVRLRFLGEREALPAAVTRVMDYAERSSKDRSRLDLIVAFNYGSRRELFSAARRYAQDLLAAAQTGKSTTQAEPSGTQFEQLWEENDPELFRAYLYAPDLPDPDLLIRTGGEYRISNFLLWQAAYSELYFSEKYWPEFSASDMMDALESYLKRQRRFGADGEKQS